jgi:hypothetical protein
MRDIMMFFSYLHLPERLQKVSKPFFDLAEELNRNGIYRNKKEVDVALRKLLEAKAAALRAVL